MTFPFTIDRKAGQPLYQQIASQVRQQVRDGRLPVGAKLPPIRDVAQHLGITRLTAQTAYDELRAGGWIETHVGRGTYIARVAPPEEWLANVGHSPMPGDVLDDQHRIRQVVTVSSLAYNEPDPELFPAGEFWGEMSRLREESATLMRYNWPQGDSKLRTVLAPLIEERGFSVMPDDISVVSGVTQAISLVVKALTKPGDYVAVERPTHLTLLNSLRLHDVVPIDIPLDGDGPRLEELERIIIQYRPRFIHTVPNFHNPTGILHTPERRQGLLGLAKKHGVMLLEDDSCGPLAYDGDLPLALKADDDSDLVIYISSLSKQLMPGLRIGYIVAPRPLHDQVIWLKRASDYCGPPFVQRALANFIEDGAYRRHLKRVVPIYKQRRDRLLQELETHMIPGVSWTRPKGGFSCWLTLPAGISASIVHRETLRQGFAFTPGDAFLSEPDTREHFRICFATQPVEVISEAVQVLGRVIRDQQVEPEYWMS